MLPLPYSSRVVVPKLRGREVTLGKAHECRFFLLFFKENEFNSEKYYIHLIQNIKLSTRTEYFP